MVEILACEIEQAIRDFGIFAAKTYDGKMYQVWQMSKEDFDDLCKIPDERWDEDRHGMWRWSIGSVFENCNTAFIVNKKQMIGFSERPSFYPEYKSLLNYLEEQLGCTSQKNIAAVCADLAKANKITMGELFKQYEG